MQLSIPTVAERVSGAMTIRLVLPAQWNHKQRGKRKEMWRRHLRAFDEKSEPGRWREDEATKLFDTSGSQGLRAFCLFKGLL